MTQSDQRDAQPSDQDVALIVGGGPGISSSCARLFAKNGMRVAIAARNADDAFMAVFFEISADLMPVQEIAWRIQGPCRCPHV